MANTTKPNVPSMPPKGKSSAKATSPPRKSSIDQSPLKRVKSSKDQIVHYKKVGIEGVCLAFCYKPDGINPSYISPIIRYLDESESDKATGHVMFLSQLCDPNGANILLQTPSATGKSYSTDIIVMSIDDPKYTYFSSISDLVNVLNDAAHNSVV